jgi:hypothetical protein
MKFRDETTVRLWRTLCDALFMVSAKAFNRAIPVGGEEGFLWGGFPALTPQGSTKLINESVK